jgi:hypothetical protein
MKSQPKFSPTRTGQLLFAVLLILTLSLLATGNAQAKRVKPDPGPIVAADNLVRWGGDDPTPGIVQANYQFCTLSQAAVDMSSGTYTCNLSNARVFYDFANFLCEVAHIRGDDWRCYTKGSQYYMAPDLEYSYSWDGDCTSDAGCDVAIVNRFTDIALLGGPVDRVRLDPLLDRVTFEGFGRIGNTTANPFDTPQSITIDYMHISFIGTKGKNKVLAMCRATPLHDEYPVTFETSVVD